MPVKIPKPPEHALRERCEPFYPVGWEWRPRGFKPGIATIQGVGINDSTYRTCVKVRGYTLRCPIYQTWKEMLRRCYSPKEHVRKPNYSDCTVCEEWLRFSNFRAWVIGKDWHNKQLDKDLKIQGNKIYSPSTCLFVSHAINSLLLDCGATRGQWPIGVHFNKSDNNFRAQCSVPIIGGGSHLKHLGYFDHPVSAHKAYLKYKRSLVMFFALYDPNPEVTKALKNYEISQVA